MNGGDAIFQQAPEVKTDPVSSQTCGKYIRDKTNVITVSSIVATIIVMTIISLLSSQSCKCECHVTRSRFLASSRPTRNLLSTRVSRDEFLDGEVIKHQN